MDMANIPVQGVVVGGCDGELVQGRDITLVQELYALQPATQVTTADRWSSMRVGFWDANWAESGYLGVIDKWDGVFWQPVDFTFHASDVANKDHFTVGSYTKPAWLAEGRYLFCAWTYSSVMGLLPSTWFCAPSDVLLWDWDPDGDGYSSIDEAGGDDNLAQPLCANGINDDSEDDSKVDDGCRWYGNQGESGAACENAINDDPTDDPIINDACPEVGAFGEDDFEIGTDMADGCGADDWPSDAWPADLHRGSPPILTSENMVNIFDLNSFLAPDRRLDTSPGDAAFSSRWDLLPGRGAFGDWINIQDYTNLVVVTPTMPPFNGILRAFNGPACIEQ